MKQELSTIVNDLNLLEKVETFNGLLDTQPPAKWIKDHPFARGVKYIPIQVHEKLLRVIFKEYRIEIKEIKQLFNSIVCVVTVHFKSPITGEWNYVDGVGAMSVQTDKGASPSDLGAIKNDAVMKAAPAAESYAIKDACEKLGKLFGADLNRKDTVEFNSPYNYDKLLSDD